MQKSTSLTVAGALVSGVTPLVFPQIPLPLGLCFYAAAVGLVVYAFRKDIGGFFRALKSGGRWDRERSIPIAFKEIRNRSGGVALFEPQVYPQRPWQLDFGEVTITNISNAHSVTLEIYLELASKDGWKRKIPATPSLGLAQDLRKDGIVARKRPEWVSSYLANPIHIKAGEVVTGRLVFLYQPFDDADELAAIRRMSGLEGTSEHLIIDDLVSGVEKRLALPCAYRGV